MAEGKSMLDVLNKAVEEIVGAEVIDGCNVEEIAEKMVTLDVAYRPVIVQRVCKADDGFGLYVGGPPAVASRVIRRGDGRYELRYDGEDGPSFEIVSADNLKIMRARYLLVLKFYQRNWHRLSHPMQQKVAWQYEIGPIFDPESSIGKLLYGRGG